MPAYRVVVTRLSWEIMAGSSHSACGVFGQRRVQQMLPLLVISLLVLAFGLFPTPSVWAGHGGPHTLAVSTTGTGGGTVTSTPPGITCPGDCTADYDDGTGVTLIASAASGSLFGGWGGACSGTGSCALTMDGDKTVTATFTVERSTSVSPAVAFDMA